LEEGEMMSDNYEYLVHSMAFYVHKYNDKCKQKTANGKSKNSKR
jgi:hypothetical protein